MCVYTYTVPMERFHPECGAYYVCVCVCVWIKLSFSSCPSLRHGFHILDGCWTVVVGWLLRRPPTAASRGQEDSDVFARVPSVVRVVGAARLDRSGPTGPLPPHWAILGLGLLLGITYSPMGSPYWGVYSLQWARPIDVYILPNGESQCREHIPHRAVPPLRTTYSGVPIWEYTLPNGESTLGST
jgi:hypothetical protein